VTAGLKSYHENYQSEKSQKNDNLAKISVYSEIFDPKEVPPPRVKWEGKCAEYCSARAMCLKRGNEEEKGPLCVPIPPPLHTLYSRRGKKRKRIQMEPKRMNSVGSTSGQYYGFLRHWNVSLGKYF